MIDNVEIKTIKSADEAWMFSIGKSLSKDGLISRFTNVDPKLLDEDQKIELVRRIREKTYGNN